MNLMLEPDPSRLWSKKFITLTACMLLLLLNLHMLLSSFPLYVKNEFNASDFTLSLVTGVFATSAIISRLFIVSLMKIISNRILLFAGLIIATSTTLLNIYVESIGFLIAIRAGYGIGFGLASTIIPTMLSQILPNQRMGEGIGYFGLAGSIAMSIGPLIGLNIMGLYSFSALAWSGTVVIVLIFPLMLLLRQVPTGNPNGGQADIQSDRQTDEQSNERAKSSLPIKENALPTTKPLNFRLFFPAILNFLLTIIYSGILGFIALFGEVIQLDQVGLFFLFNALAVVMIRPISGRLFDKRGHVVVLIPAAFSVIVSMIVLSFTSSLPMLILSALFYGIGSGAIQPTLQAWMLVKVTREQHGLVNSIYFNSTDLGIAVGVVILGAISSVSSYATMYLLSSGFMVIFLVAYVLSIIIPLRRKIKQG